MNLHACCKLSYIFFVLLYLVSTYSVLSNTTYHSCNTVCWVLDSHQVLSCFLSEDLGYISTDMDLFQSTAVSIFPSTLNFNSIFDSPNCNTLSSFSSTTMKLTQDDREVLVYTSLQSLLTGWTYQIRPDYGDPQEPFQPIDITEPYLSHPTCQFTLLLKISFLGGLRAQVRDRHQFPPKSAHYHSAHPCVRCLKRESTTTPILKKLETRIIAPTTEYIVERMAMQNIKSFLGQHTRRRKIYMIVGIKIATNGTLLRGMRNSKGESRIAVHPMPSAPMSLVLHLNSRKCVNEEVGSRAKDFIWAFSLRRMYYRKGLPVRSETFAHGAILSEHNELRYEENYEQSSPSNDDQEITVEGIMKTTLMVGQILLVIGS